MKYLLTVLLGISITYALSAQCDQPTSLQAANITPTTADLSWTPGGDEVYWGMEWGNDGFALGTGIRIDSLTSPAYNLLTLSPETSYDYYVWALCETDSSTWSALEFVTLPKNNFTCDADTLFVDGELDTVNNIYALPFGPQPECWGNHNDGDLWYVFELEENGAIEILTSSLTTLDTHIALYQVSGCDEDTAIYTPLYCSEDISGTDFMSYIITEELEAGSYYIQCGTWEGNSGIYTIEVNSTEAIVLPPNNECSGAAISSITLDGDEVTIIGNGVNATDENFIGGTHVWEAFTIDDCADVSIDFCGSTDIPTIIFSSLYDECPTQNIVQNGTLVLDYCVDDNLQVSYSSLPAGTYYYPVISDINFNGFVDYTMNISAVTCEIDPQPDTCLTWINGPWGDFNSEFGGAPVQEEDGTCPIYTLDIFSIYASESYSVDNFIEGIEYTVYVCLGEGAGTWPVEIAILDSLGELIAFEQSCQIDFVAPYTGDFEIGFNEVGACGESSENTSVANGYLSISCGGSIVGIEEASKSEFSIFPNPSSGSISITNQSSSADYRLSLFSISGQELWNNELQMVSGETVKINLPTLTPGLYLIKMINSKDQSYSIQRLIIE